MIAPQFIQELEIRIKNMRNRRESVEIEIACKQAVSDELSKQIKHEYAMLDRWKSKHKGDK